MGLFDLFNKNNKRELQNSNNEIFNDLFPNGEEDVKLGANYLIEILKNKVSYNEARFIYIKSFSLSKISNNFDIQRLKQHLYSTNQSFSEKQIQDFYVFIMKMNGTKINLLDNDNYFDKLFNILMDEYIFFYPLRSSNQNDFDFFSDKGKIFVNENNQIGQISVYAFNWLKFIYRVNGPLHVRIISISSDIEPKVDFEIKKSLLNQFSGNNINEILNEQKSNLELYKRLYAYNYLINRLVKRLLSFYQTQNNTVDFISKLNNDYPDSKNIKNINNLNLMDIERIFLRDVLSGKKLE